MFKQFSRPQGSIEHSSEIVEGETLYRVYGVYPIQDISVMNDVRFEWYQYPHSSIEPFRAVTYNTVYKWDDGRAWHAADDCNLEFGSNNSNYLFKNLADAEAYRDHVVKTWEDDPVAIAEMEASIKFFGY